MKTLRDTQEYVYPMALQVNPDFAIEIKDLIDKKRNQFLFDF